MKPYYSFIGLAAMWLHSCSDGELPVSPSPAETQSQTITLTAFTEGGSEGTRVSFAQPGSGVGAPISILWQTGDEVSLLTWYNGEDNHASHNDCLTLSSGNGTAQGSFVGQMEDLFMSEYTPNHQMLLYPYQSDVELSDANCQVIKHAVLPVVQQAVEGSVDPHAALMVARSEWDEEVSVTFRNVCSYLAVTPTYDCQAIEVESVDPSKMLAGQVTIDWNDGTPITSVERFNPEVNTLHYGASHVTLKGDIKAGKTYYVAILPGPIPQGLRVTAFSGGKYSTVVNENIVTPVRSKYHDLAKHLPAAPATSMSVDLGLTSGTRWATMNLGAGTSEDCGDYFAWGETVPLWAYDDTRTYSCYKWIPDWNSYRWGEGYDAGTSFNHRFVQKYYGNDYQTLQPADMAPQHIWGTQWVIPTEAQMQELIDGCTWQHVYLPNVASPFDGVSGYLGTSKVNGNTIFLPMAGHYVCYSYTSSSSEHVSRQLVDSYYWTSTVSQKDSQERESYYSNARCLSLDQADHREITSTYRCYALPIRPVIKP